MIVYLRTEGTKHAFRRKGEKKKNQRKIKEVTALGDIESPP